MVKSYLCVSVPVLDDDCGSLSALFMMIVSWMISFFRACVSLYVRLSLGFGSICNGMSTSSIMEVFHYVYYFYVYVVMGCFVRTSFSAVVSLLLLRLTCVCGVWLLSSLVCGFVADSHLGEFLTK